MSPQHDALQRLCDSGTFCGPYHHTALYDMLGALVLLGVVFWLRKNWSGRHYGQLFSLWVIWYGLQRFFIDFTRLGVARDGLVLEDGTEIPNVIADSVMGPLTGSQWGALGAAALGVLLFLWRRRYPVVSAEQDEMLRAALVTEEPAAAETADEALVDEEPASDEPVEETRAPD